MKKINCNLIVAGPATGKTFLAMHDKRFVDLDGLRAQYKYGFKDISELEFERRLLLTHALRTRLSAPR